MLQGWGYSCLLPTLAIVYIPKIHKDVITLSLHRICQNVTRHNVVKNSRVWIILTSASKEEAQLSFESF